MALSASTQRFRIGNLLARATAGAGVALFTVPLAGFSPANAAITTSPGPCGFHLGPPLETGAAGTFAFEVPVFPADPHQKCQTTVTLQGSLVPASGGRFTNVANDPGSVTVTLAFTGGPLPLGLLWTWSPHCADPPATAVFKMTAGGQTSTSGPQPAQSCFPDFGGSSRLSLDLIDPANANVFSGMAATVDGRGYWTATASGAAIIAKGNASPSGFLPALNGSVVGVVADPNGHGYWIVGSDGGVFSFGGAGFFGSLGGVHLHAPVVGMAAVPGGGGYWLVAADGGVFSFGSARFFGSLGGVHLSAPVVGLAAGPGGGGYWLVAYDGGVFSFGSARFFGSAGGASLAAPITAMAATPSGGGYWLLGADGGIFTYGNATFFGATPLE
jgi:hypothetical protein